MPFKAQDVKSLDDYKKAMKREAHSIVNGKTKFCIYNDVHLTDGGNPPKMLPQKTFLVVGGDPILMAPLLSHLKGTRRLLSKGSCSLVDGKIHLESTSHPIPYRLLKSTFFRDLLGKPIVIPDGKENEGGEEEESEAGKKPVVANAKPNVAPRMPEPAKLAQASTDWHGARKIVDTQIKALQQAIKAHYAQAHPNLIKEIDKSMKKLDGILDKLDHKLAEALKNASTAGNEAARATALKSAKTILADYKKYVDSEPLIAHVDSNPFGVKTNLKNTIDNKLKEFNLLAG